MLKSFSVETASGLIQNFPYGDTSNGYQIRDMDGLGPVRANIVSTSFANSDGEQYQASRREKRNILLTIGLVPDYTDHTVSSLRNDLYLYFMPKTEVTLTFTRDDGVDVFITGQVETCDVSIFTKDPVATISIICFKPDFLSVENTVNLLSKTTTDLDRITYDGTVSSGLVMSFTATKNMVGFIARVQASGEVPKVFTYDGTILIGDVITLSTVPGNKYINRMRGSEIESILAGVSPFSDWLTFYPGENRFGLQIVGVSPESYTLGFSTRFGGL